MLFRVFILVTRKIKKDLTELILSLKKRRMYTTGILCNFFFT